MAKNREVVTPEANDLCFGYVALTADERRFYPLLYFVETVVSVCLFFRVSLNY